MSFGSLAFTPLVKKLQERYGSRRQYERMEKFGEPQDSLTGFEEEFLAEGDTFYMATTGANGWPYVQHRGGPKGFLKVIDNRTLAFADFRGNKQYISTGNLLSDDRVALIFIDYPQQARLKILGRAKIFEGQEADSWLTSVRAPGYNAVIEKVYVIHIEAYDWNCQQHIIPRYTAEEIREGMQAVEMRMQTLNEENEALRKEIVAMRGLAESTAKND
jgi:predicted pyridoxine 5'-phosphate oxidase superfamily flavin-nucleotide-binding protein